MPRQPVAPFALTGVLLGLLACAPSPPELVRAAAPMAAPAAGASERIVRATGVVQALKAFSVRVPQISAKNGRVTLSRLVPNGTKVHKDDPLVEFDRTELLDEAREAGAKLGELVHQLDERKAKITSDAAKREATLGEAQAELDKARIQIRKGPILADIERLKNEAAAASAAARVASLGKSGKLHDLEEAASVRVLEKKVERQRVMIERLKANLEKLVIKAPHAGMVALENIWRSGSMGPPQEGDQVWAGSPILRVFDPTEMIVQAQINEPDIAALNSAARAAVYLDAYPGAVFEGALLSASPVAVAALESPVRTFAATFRITTQDPRLLPDLSASLEIKLDGAPPPISSAAKPEAKP